MTMSWDFPNKFCASAKVFWGRCTRVLLFTFSSETVPVARDVAVTSSLRLDHLSRAGNELRAICRAHWAAMFSAVFLLAPANMMAQQGMPELPRMVTVEAFAGPFPFTAIQKLQDPKNGATCYLYIPMRANFTRDEQGPNYGSASIGSISCLR
jgi:hypothetical protein